MGGEITSRRQANSWTGESSGFAVPGGKHTVPEATGFKKLGLTQTQVTESVVDRIAAFADELCASAASRA